MIIKYDDRKYEVSSGIIEKYPFLSAITESEIILTKYEDVLVRIIAGDINLNGDVERLHEGLAYFGNMEDLYRIIYNQQIQIIKDDITDHIMAVCRKSNLPFLQYMNLSASYMSDKFVLLLFSVFDLYDDITVHLPGCYGSTSYYMTVLYNNTNLTDNFIVNNIRRFLQDTIRYHRFIPFKLIRLAYDKEYTKNLLLLHYKVIPKMCIFTDDDITFIRDTLGTYRDINGDCLISDLIIINNHIIIDQSKFYYIVNQTELTDDVDPDYDYKGYIQNRLNSLKLYSFDNMWKNYTLDNNSS